MMFSKKKKDFFPESSIWSVFEDEYLALYMWGGRIKNYFMIKASFRNDLSTPK